MAKEKQNFKFPATISSALIAALSFAILFGAIAAATSPNRYDIRAGMASPVTITATKDVEDSVTTNALREAAAAAVDPSFVPDSSVAPEVLEALERAFQSFCALGYDEDGEAPGEITDDMRRKAANMISPAEMSQTRLDAALRASRKTLTEISAMTIGRVREYLNLNIAEGQVSETIHTVQKELTGEDWDAALAGAAADMLKPYLRANMLIDTIATEANKQAARDAVEAVIYIKGQNIVRAGEIVTRAQIEMLNSLGLLEEQGLDISLIAGVGILAAVFLGMLMLYLYTFEREMLRSPSQITLLMSILVLTVLVSWAVRQLNVYLMPTALGVMLTVYLMKPRLALMTGIVLAVFAGLIASGASGILTAAVFTTILTTSVSGVIAISVISRNANRTTVLIAGLLCGIGCMLTSVAVGLTNNSNIESVLILSCWSAGSGVLSGVLCIGVQPVLETVFNLTTTAKLFELTNPNQPLLRRLLLEAPGTYHHSIVVANLAEAAANAVGANGLMARVGSYYHDVGKLKRPLYFKENQIGDNPHDRTDPRVSAAIILAHTQDGAMLAARERIPEPVRNIISRHHGRSTAYYFYDKAVKQAGAENVDIADFTYNETLPQTREEAIVMLADPVEAAARVLKDRDPQSMGEMIDKLFQTRIQNGDLNDCGLTFHDIAHIREAFVTVLTGVYHERIEYPEPPAKKTKAAASKPLLPAQHLFAKGGNGEKAKPTAEPKPVAEPKSSVEPKPAPEAKPVPEPKPSVEQKPIPEPKPVTETKPVQEAKPVAEPKPVQEAKPSVEQKPVQEAKPVTETKTSVEQKPILEPKPAAEPRPKPDIREEEKAE